MTIMNIVDISVTYKCYVELYQKTYWGQQQQRLTNGYLNYQQDEP
jgi:hypothetical protein